MKIKFFYSLPYDSLLCRLQNCKVKKSEEIFSFLKQLERKKELIQNIGFKIEKLTGLNFKETVNCYLISDSPWRGFSNPLTIRIRSMNEFISVLTHELIHTLCLQNSEKTVKLLQRIDKKFKFPQHTKTHIWIYLVELKLRETLKLKDNPLKNKKVIPSGEFGESYIKSVNLAKGIQDKFSNKNLYKSFIEYLDSN